MEQLAKRIVTHRRRFGWSQQELARRVGASQATISRLERSQDRSPDARLLARIANEFSCPLTELLPHDLAQKLISPTESDAFYAFCPNPLCSSNKIERSEQGGALVFWRSGTKYPQERYEEINFCTKCGEQLVKECPSCKRKLEDAGTRFCQACGARVTDRPTKDEWKKIEEILNSRVSKAPLLTEEEIPF